MWIHDILWDPPCQVRGVSLRLAGGQRGIACESGRFCRLAGLGRECRLWLGRSGGATLGQEHSFCLSDRPHCVTLQELLTISKSSLSVFSYVK